MGKESGFEYRQDFIFPLLMLALLIVYGVTFLIEVYIPLFLPLIGLLSCLAMSVHSLSERTYSETSEELRFNSS